MTQADAGLAWSVRAVDWAYLMEPLFGPVYDTLARALELAPGISLLDVGCGAGRGLQRYAAETEAVSGVDVAEGLLAIAAARLPGAELRNASMTQLPWDDDCFDRLTGVNSFVYADDGALAEAHRVLVPGGLLGLGFWRDPKDFGWAMAALGEALAGHVCEHETHTPLRMADQSDTVRQLSGAGFDVLRSGEVDATSEWVDPDQAYRALASTGVIFPIVAAGAEDGLRAATTATLQDMAVAGSGIRMQASFGWIVARAR